MNSFLEKKVVNYLLNLTLNSGSAVFIILYFLSFLAGTFRFAELLCHFQVFYLCCALLGLLLGILLKKLPYILTHAILIIYLLYQTIPFYFNPNPAREQQRQLKIYQSNVEAINKNHQLVLDQINQYDPDIILLIETNHLWDKATISLEKKYLYSYKSLIGPFGYVFYSRVPIKNVSVRDFETNYNCLDILLTWEDQDIRFIAAHPPPPVSEKFFNIRNIHLINYIKLINDKKNIPTILCGDLNITPWSPKYIELVDLAKLNSTRQGFGILGSWPSWLPYKIPIDHCLITDHFGLSDTLLLPSVKSDHLPMLNEIYLK